MLAGFVVGTKIVGRCHKQLDCKCEAIPRAFLTSTSARKRSSVPAGLLGLVGVVAKVSHVEIVLKGSIGCLVHVKNVELECRSHGL